MLRVVLMAWAMLCLPPVWAQSASTMTMQTAMSPLEAVNVAGRQRMLTQRIVKNYAQLVLGVAPERARNNLEASVRLFDKQLVGLKSVAVGEPQKTTLAEMSKRWGRLRVLAVGPLDGANIQFIDHEAEELLKLAQSLVSQIEESHPVAVAQWVNLAGRERMLSQRMAKLYMLRAMGDNSTRLRDEMDAARREFGVILTNLQAVRHNTQEISRELEAIALQWEWFRQSLELEGAFSYRLLVADASESILASMDNVVFLYEKLSIK